MSINIKITKEDLNFDTNELKVSIDAVVDMAALIEGDYSRNRDGAERQILNMLVERVTESYLEKYQDEIIKGIDIEAIIKRVQLRVITKI